MENVVTETVIECTPSLHIMGDLDIPPSAEEFDIGISSLACGKSRSNDGVSPEIIKADRNSAILVQLDDLLLQFWEEGTVPRDMRDVCIITLYKNVTTVTAATTVKSPFLLLRGQPLLR